MKIIKDGIKKEDRIATGECKECGCIIEEKWGNVPRFPNGFTGFKCPTPGCDLEIEMKLQYEGQKSKSFIVMNDLGKYTPDQIRELLKSARQ